MLILYKVKLNKHTYFFPLHWATELDIFINLKLAIEA